MSLDRDELAARLGVACLMDGNDVADPAKWSAYVVSLADALLARLRPEAVAPAASATEPRRTVGAVVRWRGQDHPDEEWLLVGNNKAVALKIRKPHLLDCGTNQDGGGDEFVRWATREECERHSIPYVARPLPGAPLAAPSAAKGSDTGTAAAMPGVSPAASPAPYVPRVGDVVRHVNDDPGTDDRIVTESLCDGAFRMLSLRYSNLSSSGYNVAAFWRFVRPATAAERAAAGLPVDESAFDEAKEREAAHDAYLNDKSVVVVPHDITNFIAGWLARARVAAKGGAS